MLMQTLPINSQIFISLQALNQEESSLDGERLVNGQVVLSNFNLIQQIFHFKCMERCSADQ